MNDDLTYDPPSETTDWKLTASVREDPKDGESYGQLRQVRIIDLPVGSHVGYDKHGRIGGKWVNHNSVLGTVGKPEVLDDGSVVCKYRDIAGCWDWVEPETTFFLVQYDASKKVSVPARKWLHNEQTLAGQLALQTRVEALMVPEWERELPALEDCVV